MSGEGGIPKTVSNQVPANRTRTTPALRPEDALAISPTAAGALVLGTLAVAAVALGRIALGQLVPERTKLRRAQIDDLGLARLTVMELQIWRLLPRR